MDGGCHWHGRIGFESHPDGRAADRDGGVEDRVLSPGRLGYRRDSRHRMVPLPGERDDPGAGSDDERGPDLSVLRLDRGSDFVRQLDYDNDEWADDGSGYVVIDRTARRTLDRKSTRLNSSHDQI